MTERYLRQAYKNQLGGNTNGDENLIAKNKNILLTKAANLISSVTNSNNINNANSAAIDALNANTNSSSSSSQTLNAADNTADAAAAADACNFRNALGDIGNKLTGIAVKVNTHNLVKQQSQEGGDLLKKTKQSVVCNNKPLQAPQPQQPVAVIPQIVIQSATLVHQEPSNNNSCSMIEIGSSDDDDDDYEEEDEQVDEEDDDVGEEEEYEEDNEGDCVILDEDEEDTSATNKEQAAVASKADTDIKLIDLYGADWTLPADVLDIDEPDIDNTQLVAEYVKDIYYYLNHMERKFRVSPKFLDGKIVTSKMRSVLIDWLIQVHLKFHLLHETLYLCVQIIDAYLEKMDVSKMQLQLVGVTAMFLASKYEEMYVPAIEDFVYMTDNTYTKSEIRQMEISILKSMNFMFSKPLPLHFLRRYSKAGRADPKQHTLAKYFMELSLHDSEFSNMDPSYLAASSLCLSFKLLNGPAWNRQLEYYSTYKTPVLVAGMQKIAKLVLKSSDLDYKYRAATNKYGASKFMRISIIPELSGTYIKELANNATF